MLLCCLFSSSLLAQTGPAGVNNGAVLWLDASDVLAGGTAPAYGTTLSTWFDKSGGGHNAVSSGTNTVKYNSGGPNDRPVVNFSRTSASVGSGMTVAGLDIRKVTSADVTIFAVYRPGTNDGNAQAIWGNDNGSQQRYFNNKAATGTIDASLATGGTAVVIPGGAKAGETRLVTAVYSSGTNASAAYLNGKLISAFTDQTANATGLSTFKIGLDGDNNYYNGDVSELIVYNRKLTACEIEKVNIYLANKYATDFTDMASNYTLGIPFNNDINGVGIRTSACGGTYNISASFSGILSVTNPSATNTGVVLSFGNDRGGYGASSQTPSTYTSRLQQVWRADLNGNIGTVDVCFELTGLGIDVSNSGNFALLIDKDGDFSNATVVSTGITTLVNRVCISGASLTKGDYFTLATRAATSTASEITSTNEGVQQKSLFTTASIIDDQILVKGSSSITDGRVYIDAGFVAGDVISWGTLPTGVTAAYNATTGIASFTGTASSTDWQTFYRTMKFNTTSGTTGNRTIRFVLGNVVSYTVGSKPHYYEYITTTMSWTAAKAAAEARTLYGLQGYLATVTAQIENDFITSKLSSDGWVGGTCNYQLINSTVGSTVYNDQNQAYGNYYWVTGPEKGTPISTGLNNPVAVNGAYIKWNGGEPNNYQNTDEQYMQLYSTNQGRWNDLNNGNNLGYVVEYGGYASDPVLNIDYTRVMVNAPPAPVITSFADDNGLSTTDNITNDATLSISGNGQSSATITVYRADVGSVGTTSANGSGKWTFNYTGTTLADGTYAFTATATTGSNTSAASAVYTITVDRTAPVKPGQPALASGSGNASNDVTPDLTGSAEPGSLVKIYDGATEIGTATTNASGQWTLTAPSMSVSLHNVTVTATDVAGNVSVSSDPFALTIDLTAPNTPVAPTLVGGVAGVTNDNTPTIIGKAEPNSTVTIYNGGTAAGTALADNNGDYIFTFPVLTDGVKTIKVTATDAAGNTSAQSPALNFTVDTQAPAVPTVTTANTLTNDNTPTVTGTTDANSTVTIYKDGVAVGTTTANGSGNYTYTFSPALPDATYAITATATDAIGNTSAQSAPLNITVDATAPGAPTITTNNTITNNNMPTVTGTAEPNSTVTIYRGVIPIATTTASASGNYSYTFNTPLVDNVYALSATATDAANNTGPHSAVLNITVDTQAPPAPVVSAVITPANDNTPTVTGTAEPNSLVTIYRDGALAGTTSADASGNYTYTFTSSLPDGLRGITATATDAATNTGPFSAALNIVIDTQVPAVPTITTAQNPTADNTPTVTGTAEPNSTVTVYADGNIAGTASADASGNYTYTFTTPLSDGTHSLTARSTDGAGNTSASSATLSIVIDTQAPVVPTITTAQNPTADNTPTVTGTAEANSTVTIIIDGNPAGTATANASGNYTFTTPTPLADGTHAFTATSTDGVGNTSGSSATLNIVIDTQAPAVPTIITAQNPTADNTPTVTGTAEANSTVTIIIDGNPAGTATANASGNYTFTAAIPLSDGTHAFTATSTDGVGNTSGSSASLNIVIDTQVPAVPTITTAQNPTADNTPTVTGTAEPNSTVTIIIDGNPVGTATANASGNYTFTVPTPLADGTHAFTATATDGVGNTSSTSATLNIVIDTQAPVVPTITTAQNPTADNTPTVTGTAEANSSVTIYNGGTIVATVSANAGGNYTYTFTTPLADGTHGLTATSKDVVGNTSAPSMTLNLTIDTQAPVVPTITTAQNPTADNTPTVTGTAEANSTVIIIIDGNPAGTATANGSGNYTFTAPTPLADGTHAFTATATDVVGNTSSTSATLNIVIDTQAPVVPTITTVQNPTADNTPTVTGTAEANSTVTIIIDGNPAGTATANASGNYTFTAPTPLADGTHAFTATATDAVGNTSSTSAILNIVIDTQAPVVPTITTAQNPTADNTPTVTGTAEANSTVTIIIDGNPAGTATANASGNYTFTAPTPLADGTHAFTATSTDGVGNTSATSATLDIVIDTQAPVVPTITTAQNPTADNTPTVTGTAEANSTVTIIIDGNVAGTTTANASGNYTFTAPTPLADGTHAFTATATDAVGNTSSTSATLNIVIDTQAPVVPTITTAQNPTADNTPTVTGTAEANSTVTIIIDGNLAGTATANASGNYTFTAPTPLADGTHAFTATSTDGVGNTSGSSASLNIVIDTQAPVVPTITTAQNPTADNTPTVTGTAEANCTVTIIIDGNVAGTATANASGNYTFTAPTPLTDGTHAFTATATDAVGNTSATSATLNIVIDTQAPVIPTITTAQNPTADNTPTVTGTAEPNSTVTIIIDGNPAGTATANASGNYTFTAPTPLADGTHAFTARATDAVGNTSATSATLNIVIDTQAPVVPTITTAQNPTADNTPTVTGTAEANSTVTIIIDGNPAGTATANASGNYTFTTPTLLADGIHTFAATATDIAGNVSAPSATLNIAIDTQAPGVPTITTEKTPTSDNTPTVTGTAEANSTVTIYVGGNNVGTAKADANGNYTYTFNPALADGSYAITATATDATGNTSAHSPALNITIDAAAPETPAAPQLIGGNNGIINDATPSIKGDAEANSTVTVYVDGKPAGTTKADANGHYTYTFDPDLTDGPHNITVTATDATGNTSGQSPALAIVVDTQAPAVPTVTTDKSPTNDNTPTVTGKAEPNSTVTIIIDGKPAGTTTADGNGNYSYTFNPALPDGNHNVTTTATDAAGNTSQQTPPLSLAVDTQAPAAPTVVLETPISNGVITTTKPTISGAAEPNSTVTIYVDGVIAGTTTADANGHYTYTFNPALSQGAHSITATATDAAGNTSAPGGPLTFSIDAVAPDVPGVPVLPGINSPGLVNTGTPTITGKGEPGTTITVYTDDKAVGTAIVDANGDWSYTYDPALVEGALNITVTASDKQGNESGHSNEVILTVDLTRPQVSMLTLREEPLSGPVTFTFRFTEDVIGFSSADITVKNGTVKEFKQLSPDTYEVVLAPDGNGELTVSVAENVATDMAGNGNIASTTITLRVKFGSGIDIVFPMPASDEVNVRFIEIRDGDANITMTSMAGQVLLQQASIVKNGILKINTQRVPSGTYVLYIRMKEGTFNTTVVIAR